MRVEVKSNILDPRVVGMEKIREHIARKAMEWEAEVKEIIRYGAVDTGVLLNSIYTDIGVNGFVGCSSVEYMKYWEFGTQKHFVPFYGESGEEILAGWGRRVLKLSPDEMRDMGGIMVETPELAPMRRALSKLSD